MLPQTQSDRAKGAWTETSEAMNQIKPFFILRKLSQVLCYSNRKLTITKDWEKKLTDTQHLVKYFLTFLIFGLPHTMIVSGQDQEGRQPPSTEDSGKCVFVYSRRQFWVYYTYSHLFSFHFWILWILNPGIHWVTPSRDTKSCSSSKAPCAKPFSSLSPDWQLQAPQTKGSQAEHNPHSDPTLLLTLWPSASFSTLSVRQRWRWHLSVLEKTECAYVSMVLHKCSFPFIAPVSSSCHHPWNSQLLDLSLRVKALSKMSLLTEDNSVWEDSRLNEVCLTESLTFPAWTGCSKRVGGQEENNT